MREQALMRTNLYVGGSSPGKLLDARFYNEDCIVYDLEDSVALSDKDAARFLVYNAVRYHRPPDKYVIIRVNGLYSPFLEEDLAAAVRARPDAIRLPKVEHAQEEEIAALGWFTFREARPLVTFASDEDVLLAAEAYIKGTE